jgi:hypothetical protein
MKRYLTVMVVLLAAGSVKAEDVRGNIETARSMLATQRKALITDAMKLTPEQSQVFWPLYNDYQEMIRKVNDQKVELISDYSKHYESLTDDKAMDLLNRQLDIDVQKSKVKTQFIKKFQKVLPGRVVARFFQADSKIDAYVNSALAQEIPLVPTDTAKKMAEMEVEAVQK